MPEEERTICTELAKRINNAAGQIVKPTTQNSCSFDDIFASSCWPPQPYESTALNDFIYNGKWSAALDYLLKFQSPEDLKKDSVLSICMGMLYAKSKNRQLAYEYLSQEHKNLADTLQDCWDMIDKGLSDHNQAAEELIAKIRAFKSKYPNGHSKIFIELLIPLELFVHLKDYYQSNDKILYELHLRTAIRRCPSSNREVKQKLHTELKDHSRRYSSHIIYSSEQGTLNLISEIQSTYEYLKAKKPAESGSMVAQLSQMSDKGFQSISDNEWKDLLLLAKDSDEFPLTGLIAARQHRYFQSINYLDDYLKDHPLNVKAWQYMTDVMDYCDTLYIPESSTAYVRSTDAFDVEARNQFQCICAREQSHLFDQATKNHLTSKPLPSRMIKHLQQSLLSNVWKNALFGSVLSGSLAAVAFGAPIAIAAAAVVGYIACAFFISLRTSSIRTNTKNELIDIVSSFKQTCNAKSCNTALSRAKKQLLEAGYLIQNSDLFINAAQLEKTAELLEPSQQVNTLNWLKLISCLILESTASKEENLKEKITSYMNALSHSMSDEDKKMLQKLLNQRRA